MLNIFVMKLYVTHWNSTIFCKHIWHVEAYDARKVARAPGQIYPSCNGISRNNNEQKITGGTQERETEPAV